MSRHQFGKKKKGRGVGYSAMRLVPFHDEALQSQAGESQTTRAQSAMVDGYAYGVIGNKVLPEIMMYTDSEKSYYLCNAKGLEAKGQYQNT